MRKGEAGRGESYSGRRRVSLGVHGTNFSVILNEKSE